ncbi:PepSY domain-containing protein [Actinomyces sp.]|uniref:PepSY domain-containing protein n=1 Tax=Actinomyces sp. TaxID=29317 RepID=UPI0029152662|nr:PepSY domain-containing protein [Actinomyces sp.]MDU5232213.1 PepSY domain-containing protein [Actinomyces sp.]MDU6757610.1 PepSY domain-containing protein [Actinomyces sp.]
MIKTKYIALVSASALAFGLTGCTASSNEEAQTTAPSQTATQAQETTETTGDPSSDIIPFADNQTAIDAIKAVEAESGGKAVSLDREDSKSLWEVTVIHGENEIEYYVDAAGKVTKHETDNADGDDKKYVAQAIPMIDAIEKALADVPDGYIDEVELDEDNGTVTWQIDFDDANAKDYKKVRLDYQSGSVVEVRND